MERPHEHLGGDEHADARGEPPLAGTSPEVANGQETVAEPPRIYLTDTAAELKGVDRGQWIDATADADELRAIRDELLTMSPFANPTVAIRQVAGFEGLEIAEQEDLETVSRLARGIAAHGRAFVAYVDAWGSDQEAVDAFSAMYVGSWPNLAAWAETVAEQLGWPDQLDEHLDPLLRSQVRIDYQSLGRELTYDSYVIEDDERAQIHVFRLHA